MQDVISWLINNYLQVLGTIFGLLYIFLSIKQNIYCWPAGLLSSVLYVYVFYDSKFYADMSLQVYYVFISIYGWYNWLYGGKSKKVDDLKVAYMNLKTLIVTSVFTIFFFIIIAFVLVNYTDSPIPYWDSFTTAASIVATWMLARKYIENWLYWIVVDSLSIGLYLYKGLYAAVLLFVVYTILAVIGYFEWKKNIAAQKIDIA